MSTPIIWILIPLGLGILLAFISKHARLSLWLVSLFSITLSLLAFFFPHDLIINLLGSRYIFSEQFILFGRNLTISASNLTLVMLLYGLNFLWNLGSRSFKMSEYFNSLSLIITALWVAVLAVQPFLYSAVLIELIAMLSIPLLSPRGGQTQPGILRYLIFQTLAMPFILLSGWMLSGIATAPSANPLIIRAALMVIIGFVLWLGIFPLHSWLPMLGKESHPWVLGFLLNLLQTTLVIFLLYFLDRYAWLRNLPRLFESLQLAGAATIAIAGLISAFQTDLRREFGYLFLAETGYSLLAIGLTHQGGLPYLVMLLLPRSLVYFLWAYALSTFKKLRPDQEPTFDGIRGLFHQYPFVSSAILMSVLCLAGLPLFAIFPLKRMIWFMLPSQDGALVPMIIFGVLGMLILSLRLLHILITTGDATKSYKPAAEPLGNVLVICLLLGVLIIFGLFPHIFLPRFTDLLAPFTQLVPPLS